MADPDDLPTGINHTDLFSDNVFFRGDRLSGIIDFYFACEGLFAYELAICLNAWCFEVDGRFNITKARRMLTASPCWPRNSGWLAASPCSGRILTEVAG